MLIKKLRYLWIFLLVCNLACAEYKKIVVVGGGLAGLTTAYRLQKLTGETVEVYEARERVGGRVLTAYFNRTYAELGGKFINEGGGAPHLKALIKEMELEIDNYLTDVNDRKYYYQGEVGSYYSPFYHWKEPNSTNFSTLKKWADERDDLGSVLDTFFAGNERARHLTEIRMRGYIGNNTKDLSVHYVNSFWEYYSNCFAISHDQKQNIVSHQTIKGGNSLLPQKLAATLRGHVHYGQPLRKLSKTHDGKQFVLEFPNDQIVTTDLLILAMPCSTLRDVKVQEGIIPSDQWQAIQTLQYGTNGYILMEVNMGNEDKSEYSVTEDVIVWFNQDRSVLCLAYGGNLGNFDSRSSEAVSDMINHELPALKMLFPSLKYGGGKKQAMSWVNEVFSKGSYSSWGVDQYELYNEKISFLGESVRRVFRPINNKIFFVGEHTAIDYPATMEGAVESGERTARMIARTLQAKRDANK
jgi:monoamine oxidase